MKISADQLKELGFLQLSGKWTLPAFTAPRQARIPPALWPVPDTIPMGKKIWEWGPRWRWRVKDGLWVKEQLGGLGQHDGYDFGDAKAGKPCRVGTPVRAPSHGKVLELGWQDPNDHAAGFGKRIILKVRGREFEGLGGEILCTLAHLSEIGVVHGQEVHPGDLIALTGDTGNAEGPHLHTRYFRNGLPMDVKYLQTDQYKKVMAEAA